MTDSESDAGAAASGPGEVPVLRVPVREIREK